ncbi:MAG: hypothetical protein FWF57_02105 [Defluviitaleaceae bacterium]|nr:hypothetical protein [Defluviitaleaceae bacterium]
MKEQIKYCMEFTNEEIIKLLVTPLKKYPQLDIRFLSEEHTEITENSSEKIKYFVLDGNKENLYFVFHGHLTNLFVENEKFMFIDNRAKKKFTESDLYGEIFYEGILSNKTNKEILELLLKFIEILIGTTKIEVAEVKASDKKDENDFFIIDFIIKIWNDTRKKETITIENITFIVNGD